MIHRFCLVLGLFTSWIAGGTAICQVLSEKVSYSNQAYNTYSIVVNQKNISEFELIPNQEGHTHQVFEHLLKEYLDSLTKDESVFLTNASIIQDNCEPIGYYVKDYKAYHGINYEDGDGNFFLKPNGALLLKDDEAIICKTEDINKHSSVRIGIQSGPMLLLNGQINSNFSPKSKSRFVRSGVGIFKDRANNLKLVFAISQDDVSFHEFADFFLSKFDCENALCIESGRSVMSIPNLQTSNENYDKIVCRYLYHKSFSTEGSGTAFAINNEGYIATNYHVIEGANRILIKGVFGDLSKAYEASVQVVDTQHDLAILRIIDSNFTGFGHPPYELEASAQDVGSSVYALGYPLRATMGDEIKLTDGIISAKSGFNGDISSYQISVPIQPGNSGGPLINEQGNIIGITSAVHTGAQNVNYAIKTNYLNALIGMMDNPPKLNRASVISHLSLPDQVKAIKDFIYIIETE